MTTRAHSKRLEDFLKSLNANYPEVRHLLVHRAALHALNLSNALFENKVDLLILDDSGFSALDAAKPENRGVWTDYVVDGESCRLWSTRSLGLEGPILSVPAKCYGTRSLSPDALLRAMPLSPDFPAMQEDYARLAAILFADDMADEELEIFQRYVRAL